MREHPLAPSQGYIRALLSQLAALSSLFLSSSTVRLPGAQESLEAVTLSSHCTAQDEAQGQACLDLWRNFCFRHLRVPPLFIDAFALCERLKKSLYCDTEVR